MSERLQEIRQRWLASPGLTEEVALMGELVRRGLLSIDSVKLAWRLQHPAGGALLEASPVEEHEAVALRAVVREFAGLGPALLLGAAQAGITGVLDSQQVDRIRPSFELARSWLETRNSGLAKVALEVEEQFSRDHGPLAHAGGYLAAMVAACAQADLGLTETLLLEIVAELDHELGAGLGGRGVRQFFLRKILEYKVRMPEAWVFMAEGMSASAAVAILRKSEAEARDRRECLEAWNSIVRLLSREDLLAACQRSAELALRLWKQYSASPEPLASALRASDEAIERGEGLDLSRVLEPLEDAEAEASDDAADGEPGAALAESAASIVSSVVVFRSGLAVGKLRHNYAALSLLATAQAGAEGRDLVLRGVLARFEQGPRPT